MKFSDTTAGQEQEYNKDQKRKVREELLDAPLICYSTKFMASKKPDENDYHIFFGVRVSQEAATGMVQVEPFYTFASGTYVVSALSRLKLTDFPFSCRFVLDESKRTEKSGTYTPIIVTDCLEDDDAICQLIIATYPQAERYAEMAEHATKSRLSVMSLPKVIVSASDVTDFTN